MELVIKIPDKVYNRIKSDNGHGYCTLRDQDERVIVNAVCSSICLPEDHGRLIDADDLKDKMIGWLKPEKPDEVEMVAIDNIAVSVIMELEESQTILGASTTNKSGDQTI